MMKDRFISQEACPKMNEFSYKTYGESVGLSKEEDDFCKKFMASQIELVKKTIQKKRKK